MILMHSHTGHEQACKCHQDGLSITQMTGSHEHGHKLDHGGEATQVCSFQMYDPGNQF